MHSKETLERILSWLAPHEKTFKNFYMTGAFAPAHSTDEFVRGMQYCYDLLKAEAENELEFAIPQTEA